MPRAKGVSGPEYWQQTGSLHLSEWKPFLPKERYQNSDIFICNVYNI